VTVTDCAVLDAGHSAFWLQSFAQNVTMRGNWIERPGFCGIYFQGIYPGDTTTASDGATQDGPIQSANASDVNKNHLVSNNFIYDYGKRVGHGSGLWFFQAGRTRVTQNHVQEGPRDAFGVYGVRFGNGAGRGTLPDKLYGQQLDFWKALDNLHTRHIEIDNNVVTNCVRDTADAGALEYWGVGAFNSAHHNCFSDMDPGVLDGSWMNFLFQDDAAHYLNFSSNIVYEVKGSGSEEAGMIKSVGSVFENSIIADSKVGWLFQLTPYIEPSANMIFRRNIFSNITSPIPALAYSINGFTKGTLATSGNLKPFSNYGFQNAAPPGWPELSLDDKVIKEFDYNAYHQVQGFDASTNMPITALGWEKHSLFADPEFVRTPGSQTWNRTCHDYTPAPTSPVWGLGFGNINTSAIGLSAAGFKWLAADMGRRDASRKIQTER